MRARVCLRSYISTHIGLSIGECVGVFAFIIEMFYHLTQPPLPQREPTSLTHTCVCLRVCVSMCMCVYVCEHVCVCVCVCASIRVCVCFFCMCVCVCLCTCACACACAYIIAWEVALSGRLSQSAGPPCPTLCM